MVLVEALVILGIVVFTINVIHYFGTKHGGGIFFLSNMWSKDESKTGTTKKG